MYLGKEAVLTHRQLRELQLRQMTIDDLRKEFNICYGIRRLKVKEEMDRRGIKESG